MKAKVKLERRRDQSCRKKIQMVMKKDRASRERERWNLKRCEERERNRETRREREPII